MNNKGFTLVELLAMLVVLAALMIIAIPNITGIVGNQRLNTIRNDATTMVETAKVKVAKDEYIKKPGSGKCLIFSLSYVNDNDNIETGPNGGEYNAFDSFVVYQNITSGNVTKYNYYVRLVETKDSKNYGIELENIKNIDEITSSNIKTDIPLIGLTEATDNRAILSGYSPVSSLCSNGIERYYYCNEAKCTYK